MKEKIVFDPSLSAEGDNIGAYLRDSAGNLLTSTLVSGKQSLDVNVTQSALPAGAATESTLASRASEATLAAILADTADIEIASEASAASLAQFQFSSGKLLVESADAVPNSAIKSSQVTVTSTAAQLAASPLANRKRIKISNLGGKEIFIGDSSVTSSGFRIPPGAYQDMDLGPAVSVYAITSSGTSDVRVLEVA